MTARISGDSRASAWPMSPYSTDSSTWSSAAGAASAFSNTAATPLRVRRRLTRRRIAIPHSHAAISPSPRNPLGSLPDGDEGVLDRVRHEVAIVATPGQPDRKPASVAFVQRAEGAHVAFGDSEKQHLVARAAVHDLTVASQGRKGFTPRRIFSPLPVTTPANQPPVFARS